jgi:hypothetical protein
MGKIWTASPVPECNLSRCARSALHYSARFRSGARGWGIPGEVLLEQVRDVNADTYDLGTKALGCLISPNMIPEVGLAMPPKHESPNVEAPVFPVPGLRFAQRPC